MQYDKLIIDGNNFLFRAFFTKRPNKYINGINATPIHQFLNMIKSVVGKFRPKEIYLTWDKKLNSTKPNFRKTLVPYKEQRIESDAMRELFETIPYIQEFMDALGVKTIYPVNMEADDVIRFLSIGYLKSTIIVSSDNDLLQLITKDVHLYLPTKDVIVTLDNFEEIVTVKPELFILYKAILGDKSDNIEGISGYGPVKSKILAQEIYDDHEIGNEDPLDKYPQEIFAKIDLNKRVMDLRQTETEQPEEYGFYCDQAENIHTKFDSDKLRELFENLEMIQFLKNFGEWNRLFNPDYDNSDLLLQICM